MRGLEVIVVGGEGGGGEESVLGERPLLRLRPITAFGHERTASSPELHHHIQDLSPKH